MNVQRLFAYFVLLYAVVFLAAHVGLSSLIPSAWPTWLPLGDSDDAPVLAPTHAEHKRMKHIWLTHDYDVVFTWFNESDPDLQTLMRKQIDAPPLNFNLRSWDQVCCAMLCEGSLRFGVLDFLAFASCASNINHCSCDSPSVQC
jgi:hypothetical protein